MNVKFNKLLHAYVYSNSYATMLCALLIGLTGCQSQVIMPVITEPVATPIIIEGIERRAHSSSYEQSIDTLYYQHIVEEAIPEGYAEVTLTIHWPVYEEEVN